MALNEIGYDGKVYADQDIEEATGYRKSTIVGDELPSDTFEAEVWDYAYALLMLADNGPKLAMINADGRFMLARFSNKPMEAFTYGAPVTWTHQGKLVLKQYLESIRRTGEYKYLLSCVSGIGLLAKSRHYGGLYENALFSDVLAEIVGGAFPYTVDTQIASIKIYGALPVDNRRNNLKKLLVATGAVLQTNPDGSVRFTGPDTTSPVEIKDGDIFMGGSVDIPTPYQAVKITEHAFAKTSNDILTTLLDGEAVGMNIITPAGASVTGALVTFSDPMHDLAITGTTILESGVNYAVLAPSTSCTLTGYKYSHTTRIVTAGSLTASEQATKRLDDNTLISLFNVDTVAQRWLDYYSAQKAVTMSVVWRGEQPAGAVVFADPYDERAVGLIESQDVRLSAKLAADTTVQVGKIPPISGNTYEHVLVVTQSGTVTIPAEAKGKAQLVLISGGHGGSSGFAGKVEHGKTESSREGAGGPVYLTKWYTPPGPAAGGDSGDPGTGAKILRVTLKNISPGQTVLNVNIGAGGPGGLFSDVENSPGQSGGDTTVGDYTTEGAQESTTGYYDPIDGVLYGAPGGPGVPGGDGGGFSPNTEGRIIPAKSVTGFGQTFPGGNSVGMAEKITKTNGKFDSDYGLKEATAWGGYGGGAAYGAKGEDGILTGAVCIASYSTVSAKGAPGGSGATALPPPVPSTPGTGGFGGNGGGGAGACGSAMVKNNYDSYKASPAPNFSVDENTMTPGNGSDGGKGADGVLLIYY